MAPVCAVSFDLWDTVFIDDSDEPKRARMGLPPKAIERRNLVHEYLNRRQPIDRNLVDAAYNVADAAFRHVWLNQHLTWTVAERLKVLLAGLKRELPPTEFDDLVRLHEEMELRVSPDLVPGVEAALAELSSRYRLVVVSDAIFSPGRALRQLLARYGLLGYFSAFVFSDEAGCSKPAPAVFHRIAELAGCPLARLVHIGDRESNDIAGPKAVGARAVLLTAAIDRGTAATTAADAVCRDYKELVSIIDTLSATEG